MQNQITDIWLAIFDSVGNLTNPDYDVKLLADMSVQMKPYHDDVIKWKKIRFTGPLCGEYTGCQWILPTKTSDADLWYFPWSAPK